MAKSYLSPFSWIEDLFGEGFIFAITLSGSSLVYEEWSFLKMHTAKQLAVQNKRTANKNAQEICLLVAKHILYDQLFSRL